MVELFGWAIELSSSPPETPVYWAGSSLWTYDPYRALRFLTKKDAEAAAFMMLAGMDVRVREHGWGEASTETISNVAVSGTAKRSFDGSA